MPFRVVLTVLIAVLWLAPLAGIAPAQSKFGAAIAVNNSAVTFYEIEQRAALIEFLGIPGNARELAEEGLIDDRLREQAAADAGITLAPEEVDLAVEEFAGRANLTTAELVERLAFEGIAPETLVGFLEPQVLWREVVRSRFTARARPSDAEIDRALAVAGTQASARIRLAEIVLPAGPGELENTLALARDLARQIDSVARFTQAAERFSVAPTRTNGGLRDWVSLSDLPPALAGTLLTLGPGEVSEPFPFGEQAVALFQVRALEESAPVRTQASSLEYALVALPGTGEEARAAGEELRRQIDVCDDLYPFVRDYPAGAFLRETKPVGQVPRDVANILDDLDPDEVSFALQRGATRYLVMLCARTTELPEGGLEQIQVQLFNNRLTSYADSYLAELRADARIRR